jgi:cell division protein FtsQ
MNKKMIRGANRHSQKETGIIGDLTEKFLRLLMVMIFIATLYGADFIYKQIDTPLTRVTIGGEFIHLQESELADLVLQEIDGGFLSMNLHELRQELQQHPWIHEVSVRREWPSTLQVEVLEEVPIARWGRDGFLNKLGDQLTLPENSRLHSLPVLEADYGSSQDMIEQYQLISELLIPVDLKLAELQRDAVGAWRFDTKSGLRIVLGRGNIVEKMQRLAIVWRSGLETQSHTISAVDLRYPNGLAVSWKDQKITATSKINPITTDSEKT